MRKQIYLLFLAICALVLLTACGSSSSSAEESNDHVVKLGVSSIDGPVWDLLVEKAKEEGIELEIIELSDWQLPNDALVNGELDMNVFQHIAFLSQYNVQKNENLVPIGSRSIVPKGLYSIKYEDIAEIPEGAKVAISNDTANMGLDLGLLETVGLIEVDDEAGIFPTPGDITENPKKLIIEEVDPQQTARILPDVALTAIYSSTAERAGISQEEALYINDPLDMEGFPYVGVFVVRSEDVENETYKKVASLYQDPEIKEALKKDTNGLDKVVNVPVEELQETLEKLMEE